jgi:Zn-dependent membrane protease YugP
MGKALPPRLGSHECGHAIQHAAAYSWLTMRSTLVPVVKFGGTIVPWVLIAGIVLMEAFPMLLSITFLFIITGDKTAASVKNKAVF